MFNVFKKGLFMKRNFIVSSTIVLTLLSIVWSQTQFIRPLPPDTITQVSYLSNGLVVNFTPSANDSFESSEIRYHAVLVNDLTISLQHAYELGKSNLSEKPDKGKTEGVCISKDTNNSATSIGITISKPDRYYLAVSTSGIRKNSLNRERIYSGWKLHTKPNGVPEQIIFGKPTHINSYAHRFSEGSNNALFTFSFSVDSAETKSLQFFQNTTARLSIPNLSVNPSGDSLIWASDISQMLTSANSAARFAVLRTVSGNISHYTVTVLVQNAQPSDTFKLKIMENSTGKILAEEPVFIPQNKGLENILATTYALLRMPLRTAGYTENPIDVIGRDNISDSTQVKLLSSFLFHNVIAHNSLEGNSNEEEAGIYDNYIQYFDDIVRNWSSLNVVDPGRLRLQAIYNRILGQNRDVIVDSVWVKVNGTISEYLKPVKERMNYAFYDGYSRLSIDLETPAYTNTQHSGSALELRISPNISVYRADLFDTLDMFKDTVIRGGNNNRRIIISAKDTLVNLIDSDGLWIIANSNERDSIFYTGLNAIRLSLKSLRNYPIDSSFALGTGIYTGIEKEYLDDPIGMIQVGSEKSLLSIKVIDDQDTLKNTENPSQFLHGQQRLVTYNKDYFSGDSLEFMISAGPRDMSKIMIDQQLDTFSIVLQDTSVTREELRLYAREYINTIPIRILIISGISSRRLCFPDVNNGKLNKLGSGLIELQTETDHEMLLSDFLGGKGEIVIRYENGIKIFKNQNIELKENQLLPDINTVFKTDDKENKDSTMFSLVTDWQTFKREFLQTSGHIYVQTAAGKTQSFSIGYRRKGNQQEILKEQVTIKNIDFRIFPLFATTVSADSPYIDISSHISIKNEEFQDVVVTGDAVWNLIGTGGSLSNTRTSYVNGEANVTLNAGTNANDVFRVGVTVENLQFDGIPVSGYNLTAQTDTIKVVAGEPFRIVMDSVQTNNFDGVCTTNIEVQVYDRNNNLCNGDGIQWLNSGDNDVVSENGTLQNGRAELKIRNGTFPEGYEITAKAGTLSATQRINSRQISISSISIDQASLDMLGVQNHTAIVRIVVNNASAGTIVEFYSTNGKIEKIAYVDDRGIAETTLDASDGGRVGSAKILAKVGDASIISQGNFHFYASGPLSAEVEHNFIAGDISGNCLFQNFEHVDSIQQADSSYREVRFYSGTVVRVKGRANDRITISGICVDRRRLGDNTIPPPDPICGIYARTLTGTDEIQLDANGNGSFCVTSTGALSPADSEAYYHDVILRSTTHGDQFRVTIGRASSSVLANLTNLFHNLIGDDPNLTGAQQFAYDMVWAIAPFKLGDIRDVYIEAANLVQGRPVNALPLAIASVSILCGAAGSTGILMPLKVLCSQAMGKLKVISKRFGSSLLGTWLGKSLNDLVKTVGDVVSTKGIRAGIELIKVYQLTFGKLIDKLFVCTNEQFQTLVRIFNSIDVQKAFVKVSEKLTKTDPNFNFADEILRISTVYGEATVQKLCKTFNGVGDDVIKELVTNREAFEALQFMVSKNNISINNLVKAFNNDAIYVDGFSRAELIIDAKKFWENSAGLYPQSFNAYFRRLGEAVDDKFYKFIQIGRSKTLSTNLKRFKPLPSGMTNPEAHHIIPSFDGGDIGDKCRKILIEAKININEAFNGVWLEKAVHRPIHTADYYDKLLSILQRVDAKDTKAVKAVLGKVANQLEQFGHL
jgi:hypothetical protein